MEGDGGEKNQNTAELPKIASQAIKKHASVIERLKRQRIGLSNRLDAQGVGSNEKNRLLVPVIEENIRHRKAIKAVKSEWMQNDSR